MPSLAPSSALVDDDVSTGKLPPKVATGDLIPTTVPCQVAWSEAMPTNTTPTVDTSVEVSVFCVLQVNHSCLVCTESYVVIQYNGKIWHMLYIHKLYNLKESKEDELETYKKEEVDCDSTSDNAVMVMRYPWRFGTPCANVL